MLVATGNLPQNLPNKLMVATYCLKATVSTDGGLGKCYLDLSSATPPNESIHLKGASAGDGSH